MPTLAEAGVFFTPNSLRFGIAINVQPVIMGDHNNIVISREAFAIVGKEIMPAATGKPTAMHVNHDWAFMAAVDLGCPKIQAQAVFAGYCGCCTTMEHKRLFIPVRKIVLRY